MANHPIYHINPGRAFTLQAIREILHNDSRIVLTNTAKKKILACSRFMESKIKAGDEEIYGVTTGFGSLHDQKISPDDRETLQRNLVVSHACGTGDEVPREVVQLMLLLKIRSLAMGYSGVRTATVERLAGMYNAKIYPVVYRFGSLGASGDLAPLAHLSLPLIGEGKAYFQGVRQTGKLILRKKGWQPLKLQPKEGLALLNGTQFMGAYGVWCLLKAERLMYLADLIAAMSADAYDCRPDSFDLQAARVRPYQGHAETSRNMQRFLHRSSLQRRRKNHVQDPYSFRCIPQVHGAVKDAVRHVEEIVTAEINSVSDNPLVFPENNRVISAGNFHGQSLAMALDYLAISIAALGSISERRIYKLNSGQRGLPPFLTPNPGLNSGFMITQYTAAALVSRNKQLCTPASVDSIDSSNGQEDFVSMGANAAVKALEVVENVERILAIELFNAAQALEFRRPARSSPAIEKILREYRRKVPFLKKDDVMFPHIAESVRYVRGLVEQ